MQWLACMDLSVEMGMMCSRKSNSEITMLWSMEVACGRHDTFCNVDGGVEVLGFRCYTNSESWEACTILKLSLSPAYMEIHCLTRTNLRLLTPLNTPYSPTPSAICRIPSFLRRLLIILSPCLLQYSSKDGAGNPADGQLHQARG